MTLSARAGELLAKLKRRAAPSLDDLRRALDAKGVPHAPALLEFHETFGGLVYPVWGEPALLGLVHAEPEWQKPLAVAAYRDPDDELWHLLCADVHPSWELAIDEKGTFYSGRGPEAASFALFFEQAAFIAGLGPVERLDLSRHNAADHLETVLRPRLARVAELSDAIRSLLVAKDLVVSVHGKHWEGWLTTSATVPELEGIALGGRASGGRSR